MTTKNLTGKPENIKEVKKTSKRTIFYPPHGEIDQKFQRATLVIWHKTNCTGVLSRNEVLEHLLDYYLSKEDDLS